MLVTKGIVTALQLEADKIIEKYQLVETKKLGTLTIYEGKRGEGNEAENLVLLVCGEGKTQSAFATTYLCENYELEKIINIGIVGNLNPSEIKIGDVILPNTFVIHDFYMPEEIDFHKHQREAIFLDYAIGEDYDLEKFTLHLSGICATGDQFIDNNDLKDEIRELYSADIVDMEVYSVLSVLKNYSMLDKAIVIKSVSDDANDDSKDDAMGNLHLAMDNAIIILDFVL